MKWYTSDWNLKINDDRSEGLLERVLKGIAKGDHLYILGDIAEDETSLREAMLELKKRALEREFKVTLLVGNKDRRYFKYLLKNFCPPVEGVKWFYLKTIHIERINGIKVTLTHYPLVSFDQSEKNAYHLHGHLKMASPMGGKVFNVTFKRGKVYSEEELQEILQGKENNWDFDSPIGA